MKKKYSKFLIFTLLVFSGVFTFAQTTFAFNNISASGSSSTNMFQMLETVGSKSILVDALNGTNGVLISVNNLNGFGGTDGNVIRSNPANRVDFTFNEAADVISIITLNGENVDDTFSFTPVGGNGTVVQATIAGQAGVNVQLGWQGATGFSVTSNLGTISYFFDTLVIDNNTLSTKEFNLNTVSIYPNPTTNVINIKSNITIKNIELYNILGKKIKSTKSATVSLIDFSKGIYIIKITTDKGVVTKKITKI